MGSEAFRRNGMTNVMQLHVIHPADDAALIKTRVTGNFPSAPIFVENEPGCLQTQTRKVRIGGVRHVHTVRRGDAKALSHYTP